MKTLCTLLALVIQISSQADFDKMGETLIGKIRSGEKDLTVKIQPGVYFFREDHLDLSQVNEPDVRITLIGEHATIVAEGARVDASHPLDPLKGYVSLSGGNADPWGPFQQSDRLIEVLSSKTRQCRISRVGAGLEKDSAAPRFLRITRWYHSSIYPVEKMDDSYVYFTADDLTRDSLSEWNVNDDYNYGHLFPRFSLLSGVTQDRQGLHECRTTRFLKLWYGSGLRSFSMSGLRFLGNAREGLTGLLEFMCPQCECSLSGCAFEGIRSARVISVGNRNEVRIEDCVFRDIYEDGVNASHSSVKTEVIGCRFERCGLGMQNSFCVSCAGSGFRVAHNLFSDFGYSAIGLGYGYLNEKTGDISGIAEYNRLYYSDEWAGHPDQHTLMDSGAIYVSTQNDRTVIRYNRISSYTGMKDNRGIFCDDGAYNLEIYGNTILGITNSYSIDSRRCKRIERDPQSKVQRVNFNIKIYDNVTDAPVRFEPRED